MSLLLAVVGIVPQARVSNACIAEPPMTVPSDAVVEREILGDVDGDGHREVITGYTRPGTGEAYLHVQFATGWSTALRVDDIDPLFTAPRPESVAAMGEGSVIVVRAGPIAVGSFYAFVVFRGCVLVPLALTSGELPDIWIGGGPQHGEWFSCRNDGVVQVQTFRQGFDPTGEEAATITLYPLEDAGFGTAVHLALGQPLAGEEVGARFPPCPLSGTFVDDDGSLFEADIEWLAARGFIRGCDPPRNDRVCPDPAVTRGQLAALLSRALLLSGTSTNHFSDDDASVFAGDIDRLAAAGITRGCNPPANDRYCPDSILSRAQAAAILSRAFGLPSSVGDHFTDDDGSIFEADINRVAAAGITRGCNPPANDRFCPYEPVTRAQMAALLRRGLDLEPAG